MTSDSHEGHQLAIAALAEMIESIPVMMLTARLRDGSLRSLPMARVQAKFDGSIYLFADPLSETLADLKTQPQVNLSHADVPQCRYVSLSGDAEHVSDRPLAEKLWNPDYREWLPRGVHDPLHGLFRATILHAEYWDAAHSAMRQIGGLMKGLFTGNRPAVGDHESINLTNQ
ncbi:MAG: pyridoxamine 5'-phosphate oxidase family protein [Planctomycetes bacterium]|nr:pyridoxamine 5'-phosphate oxidase family protein [Planctomycetota bacterium]